MDRLSDPNIAVINSDSKVVSDIQISQNWSENEEQRIKRKLDLLLMPLVVLGLFALQLDKSNISNALTSTITTDLGISSDTVNAGNQLQQAGIVIFEIPSNILLQRVGAPIWITFQALAWGSIALFQAFVTNKQSFFATRFLLGMFESGYLPGSMFILSWFYKRDELALRTTVLYIGNYFAAGTGSFIAAGVFKMSGTCGLSGWRWLFIIDGAFTVLVGVLFVLFLPKSPLHTRPLCGFRCLDMFSERDRQILHNRVLLDDPHKNIDLADISFRRVIQTLLNYRLWGHFAINIIALTPKGGLQLYSPTIIKKLGFSTLKANALSSVSNYGVIVLALMVAWASDKTKLRGPWCLLCGVYSLIFAGVQYSLVNSTDKWLKYAIFVLLNSGNAVAQGINDAWLSSNAQSPQERSIGLALAVIGSNLGGLAGQQLFQSKDAPHYNNAFLSILVLYAAALVMITLQIASYFWDNRQLAKKKRDGESLQDESGLPGHPISFTYEL
ncbi:hypothetical protein BP6252_02063 [Coleophoma cylindrospora]|uniref:Major facilitator superfamily (MFS) profile domain-containing protein n=1 Tax=Coleophoma cylindrospora TaxID=1849047 RepID=A0A3D8SDT4_9HELO|nr:hypothetical protein BP6252_02063 [Coleophoma cylindrospora]